VNPMLQYTRTEAERVLADVLAIEPKKPNEVLTRLHAAAMLAASLGRTDDVRRYTDEFEANVARVEHPEAHAGSLAGLRARVALLEGKPDRALDLLNGAHNKVWFGWAIGSTYWSQVADRYLRAELLRKSGRYDEALRWYASIEEFSANDLAWLGAARARRAEMLPMINRPAQLKR
jgi:ATP/maltotriose-dependent transcriptional regulator MalT